MLFLLISAPILWILRFKDKTFGFVSVISAIIAGNALFAVFLQSLNQFKYPYLLSFHILVALITFIFNYKNLYDLFKKINLNALYKIPWFLLIAVFIIAFQFYSVHFNYTGKITTISEVKEVENFKSGHPYFSDEWISVALSEKSIETQGLPFVNVFNDSNFVNFLFVFHSLISGIDLILKLDLLSSFQAISIFFSLILILFTYVLLRSYKISLGVSLLFLFFISYLPNGSNLPLLWNLLPWNLGFIFFLAYLISVSKNQFKCAILFNLFSIIFYPPLVVLSLPSFIFSIFKIESKREKIKNLSIYLGLILLGLISSLIFISFANSLDLKRITEVLIQFSVRNLDTSTGDTPLFIVWRVIPWFIAPFAFWSLWKKRREFAYLSIPIFIGLFLWSIYSVNIKTFFIDYHRIVAITSILLLIISAFSVEDFKNYLFKKNRFLSNKTLSVIVTILFLISMFIGSFYFTQRENWMNFKLGKFYPSPPANNYLVEDDLKLFENIHEKRFLAVPWKGLVLSVVTDNIPVITKHSTLSINLVDYQKFMLANCVDKKEILKKFKVNYVYTPEIKCDGLKLVGKSSEGLHLYLVE